MTFIDNANTLVIAFRGSQQPKDWVNDFDGWHTVIPYGNFESDIRVHQGFLKCYKSVRDEILCYIEAKKDKIKNIYVTGHSLGGALSLLCAVDVQYNTSVIPVVYTSGAPCVGNKAWAESYNRRVPATTRTYARCDVVPKLPPWWFLLRVSGGYKHVSASNPIGPKDPWVGFFTFLRLGKKFAENVTNHSIELYEKWC